MLIKIVNTFFFVFVTVVDFGRYFYNENIFWFQQYTKKKQEKSSAPTSGSSILVTNLKLNPRVYVKSVHSYTFNS